MSNTVALRKDHGTEPGREFSFEPAHFERVRRMIYEHAGITLAPSKEDMVYSRLSRRLRARGLQAFGDYLALLDGGDADEWQAFTNALTTNLTAFFREEHHFPLLAEHLTRVWRAERRPLTVWCCAASTGEEPYSIAMTALDAFDGTSGMSDLAPPVSILATDVDTDVLTKAARGEYAMERVEKLDAALLKRHFLRGRGANEGVAKVRPELRALIEFKTLNLLAPGWPVKGPYDVIFCRNVMIYFDKPTQRGIIQRFTPLLRPDGLLFTGHSESFQHCADEIRLRGRTVYERASRLTATRSTSS